MCSDVTLVQKNKRSVDISFVKEKKNSSLHGQMGRLVLWSSCEEGMHIEVSILISKNSNYTRWNILIGYAWKKAFTQEEDDSCVGPSSTLYAPNVFISSLTKARSRNLWLYLRYEFRPVGSVSLSKLYRRVGVWRPFSAVDRWVWRLIEILSEIEAWSKRPCLKMSVWALGNCDGHIYTGLNILHSAD